MDDMDMAVEAPTVPVVTRNLGGRPTVRTPEARARILDAIARGYTQPMAALAAGISTDVLERWKRDPSDPEFAVDVVNARTEATIFHFEQAQEKAEHTKDWRWNDRVLQVLDRETWGKQETVTVQGETTVTHALSDIDVAALNALSALLGSVKAIEGTYSEIAS